MNTELELGIDELMLKWMNELLQRYRKSESKNDIDRIESHIEKINERIINNKNSK